MSHITATPPSSPPSQASGPDSSAHNSLLSLSASEREALFLRSPMSSKTVMNAMQWPRKWTLEREREEKKAILRLWRSIITLLPSPSPLPSRAGAGDYICVSVCVHLSLRVSPRAYVLDCVHVNLYECAHLPLIFCLCVCMHTCVFDRVCELRSPSRENGRRLTGRPIVGLIKHFRFNTPSLSLTQTLAHHSFRPHFS